MSTDKTESPKILTAAEVAEYRVNTTLRDSHEALRAENTRLQAELKDFRRQRSELLQGWHTTEMELQTAQQERDARIAELGRVYPLVTHWHSESNRFESALQASQQEVADVRAQLQTALHDWHAAVSNLRDAKVRISELQSTLQASRQEAERLRTALEKVQHDTDDEREDFGSAMWWWDTWRSMISQGDKSSLPRDSFVSWLGVLNAFARAALSAPSAPQSHGISLISAERQRQVSAEGWTPEHDAEHIGHEILQAAICYARTVEYGTVQDADDWPWDVKWWKPSADPIRNLVKAGALIAAEIDRMALSPAPSAPQGEQVRCQLCIDGMPTGVITPTGYFNSRGDFVGWCKRKTAQTVQGATPAVEHPDTADCPQCGAQFPPVWAGTTCSNCDGILALSDAARDAGKEPGE